MNEDDRIQLRVHGGPELSTLVYLPGLHGDWTLIGAFRHCLAGRLRFIEVTYPRTVSWSLEDYAAHVETALAYRGIAHGWLLGESFGSQVVWPMLARRRFQIQAVILAGGFLRHPMTWGARLAERICGGFPAKWLARAIYAYARISRLRYWRQSDLRADLAEFIARRTKSDIRAVRHRLGLVASSDPTPILAQCKVPIYALAGAFDPIVPWVPVRRCLKRNGRSFREFVVLCADHNVLSTAARRSADQICRWMLDPQLMLDNPGPNP